MCDGIYLKHLPVLAWWKTAGYASENLTLNNNWQVILNCKNVVTPNDSLFVVTFKSQLAEVLNKYHNFILIVYSVEINAFQLLAVSSKAWFPYNRNYPVKPSSHIPQARLR